MKHLCRIPFAIALTLLASISCGQDASPTEPQVLEVRASISFRPFDHGERFGWLAYDGTEEVASVEGYFKDSDQCVGYVEFIYVGGAYRGEQIGTRLARLMTGEFIRRSAAKIEVLAIAAPQLWTSQGYTQDGKYLSFTTGISCPKPDPNGTRSGECPL